MKEKGFMQFIATEIWYCGLVSCKSEGGNKSSVLNPWGENV
jgi:hypothetical protein